ncbi:hypothetical protein ACEPAH_1266 [Sanghuangporus vaninii]
MSRRRTTRLSAILDTSFQLPLAINSTSNNLLLQDENLEHDFFDGFEYTLTTPVPSKASSSNLSTPILKPRPEYLGLMKSDQENSDCSYTREEGEMANTDVDEETPRARGTQDPTFLVSSPTPRLHPNRLISKGSNAVLRLPASISNTPVRPEAFIAMDQVNGKQSSSAKQPRSSASPSITPKPKQGRARTSQASPSGHSARVGATVPPSLPRSCEGQFQLRSKEAEVTMSRHQHASSSPFYICFPSESALSERSRSNRVASASVNDPSRSPRSPERTPNISKVHAGTQRPNALQRRRPRLSARSASPSGLSRIEYDAVMFPIQEEEEDLQARDDRPPISKSQQNLSVAEPSEEPGLDRNKLVAHKNKKLDHSSTAASSKTEVLISKKGSVKRSGDSLAVQLISKKRKTEVNIINPDSNSAEDGYLRTVRPRSSSIDPTSTRRLPEQVLEGNQELDVPASNVKPVTPDSNYRPPPSPISQLLIELRSETPLGVFNTGHNLEEDNQGGDEVQDFLSRVAKKYGSGGDRASTISVAPPKEPLPVISEEGDDKPPTSTASQQSTCQPETLASKGKLTQPKARQPPVLPNGKNGIRSTSSGLNRGIKRASAGRHGHTKRHSVSGAKNGHGSRSEKTSDGTEDASSNSQATSRNSRSMMLDVGSRVLSPCRGASMEQETPILPDGNEMTVNSISRQADEIHSDQKIPLSWGLTIEGDQRDDLQARQSSLPVLAVPGQRVQSEAQKEVSESIVLGETAEPDFTVEGAVEIVLSPRRHRSVNGEPPKRPSALSAQPAPKTTRNPQPRSDDMFARKKRDNYLQKGLDLTPYSSRRFAEKASPAATAQSTVLQTLSKESPRDADLKATVTHNEPLDVPVAGPSRSISVIVDLVSDAKDQKLQYNARPNTEFIDPSEGESSHASSRSASSKAWGKQAVKPDTERLSNIASKRKALSSDSDLGLTRHSKSGLSDNGDVSATSVTERLLHVGQKVMSSLGLLTSQSNDGTAEVSKRTEALHDSELGYGHQAFETIRGSIVKNDGNITDQTQLLWHRTEQSEEIKAGSDGQACNFRPSTDKHSASGAISNNQPLRLSQKRKLTSNTQSSERDDLHETTEEERVQKRLKISREDTLTAGLALPPKPSRSDKSRRLITNRTDSVKGSSSRGLLVNKKNKPTKTRATPPSADASSLKKSANGLGGVGPAKNSCSLTVPVAPVFTTDTLHQQRLIARSERKVRYQEDSAGGKTNGSKSDDRTAGDRAKARIPSSGAQTREPWKPTVPHAFRFETDYRVANRRQEFQAKLKVWEQRAAADCSSNKQCIFGGMHSNLKNRPGASLEILATRRREQITPTIPVSPHFMVDTRLAQRHKFDDAQRAKEKEAERIREEQRRAKEAEEEREWREARKRTIPRANQIPEWYTQVPKRTAMNR